MQAPLRQAVQAAAVTAALAAALMAAGCAKRQLKVVTVVPDQRPTVELTQFPASSTDPYFYVYEIRWSAYDPDGRVAYYLYTLDPPRTRNTDSVWVRTTDNRRTFSFRSTTPDSAHLTSRNFHEFVIKAVDDQGLASEPVSRSFFSFTVAPTVQITSPHANHLLQPQLTSTTRIGWQGSDPDGQHGTQPVKYKFKLFTPNGIDFDFLTALVNPDSLRRFYAPGFATWDSVSGDTNSAQFTNLTPGQNYLFVVVAFDEAGAYSPVMSEDVNMLYFYIGYAGVLGPKLTVYDDFFNYVYPNGGFSTDPSVYINVEVPAQQVINFYWFATPPPGADIHAYRWCMDIDDISNETPRQSATDVQHWSTWGLNTTAAGVGPFPAPSGSEQHFFYIEVEDNNDFRSLGIVNFVVVRPTFVNDLLFVDDTRYPPDKLNATGNCIIRIPGGWPTMAELDTFFFARGGFPWKCQVAGTLSPPGIFAGYHFDSISTRVQRGGLVTLTTLTHYRHVIWSADHAGALNTNDPDYAYQPMEMLRWGFRPNGSSVLGLYIALGGEMWMNGGGVATATQIDWDHNGGLGGNVYSHATGELVAGRFMYDYAHWQSEITATSGTQAARSDQAIGGWPGAPDYSLAPPLLQAKSVATDPLPPQRFSNEFYQSIYTAEFLDLPNQILEVVPNTTDTLQTLDTLYNAAGGSVGFPKPVMTLYHRPDKSTFIFSGFPMWYFRRQQVIDLADFVLQNVWGLSRDPVSRDLFQPQPLSASRRPSPRPQLPASTLLRQRGGRLMHR